MYVIISGRIQAGQSRKTVEEVFNDFVISQTAQGLSETTIATYRCHIHSISKHLDIQKPMNTLTKGDLEAMVVSMRRSGLAHNSISSYCRVLRTFLNWSKRNGWNSPELPNIKDKETVKEPYTDDELLALLKRPEKNCSFCDYRNWVIVNFLMNSGFRSATVRNIQNRDVDLDTRQILLRHNKNGKIQTVPLCSVMVSLLREYMTIRGGKPDDYLFCDQYGGMLSMNALRLAVGTSQPFPWCRENQHAPLSTHLRPEILGGLWRGCFYAPKVAGALHPENDKALLCNL